MQEIQTQRTKDKDKPLTVKIELHRVDPYKIMWVGEKTYSSKGQEETFVRFTIDKDGNQIDRKTFQSTVAVVDYVSTINRSSREVVMAEFIIKAIEYTIVGELIDEDTRLKGIVREKIDMTGLLQPLAIYPPFITVSYTHLTLPTKA